MSSPNEPRDPYAPDDEPRASGAGDAQPTPGVGETPSGGEAPRYPAGTSPDAPAAPAQGQPPAYGQPGDASGGQPPAYPQAPAYGQAPGYGQAPSYGDAPAYGQAGQDAAQQGWGDQPAAGSTRRNALGIWSLVLGILSIVLCCVGWLPGIPAVILGFLGRSAASRGEATNRGIALAGIILGAIGLVIGLYWLISFVATMAEYGGWNGFTEYLQDEIERQQQLQTP
ncbi:DUF4190 domain-containing protein [Cellulomonas sp. JZ18]|uniref:DUF4190 domain-containing protein n=1 Tax=Cellulomonas sp. JZ18 TaxID=2654191 RepID=UPI0012D49D2C|nr:DUF4190 domain-containing protein [Cellulomonas sp. JZ18]QGQ19191.1 DUF4190 domain-containing protein [Cellulomonas sp. JZ18]